MREPEECRKTVFFLLLYELCCNFFQCQVNNYSFHCRSTTKMNDETTTSLQRCFCAIVLVVLQFSTLLLIASAFFWIPFYEVLWPRVIGCIIFALGIVVMVAGVVEFNRVNRGGKNPFPSVLPIPTEEAKLVTSGIWSWIRHPLYFGVLSLALGLCCWHQHWATFIMFAALLVILCVKGYYEETLLTEEFPSQYPRYQARTCMLIPFPCCWRYSEVDGLDSPDARQR